MAAAPVAREYRAKPARMAADPEAPEPQVEPVQGAEGAPRPARAPDAWVRDWDAVPNPLGGEALPVVLEVPGWLNWVTSGDKKNRPFNAVLLR